MFRQFSNWLAHMFLGRHAQPAPPQPTPATPQTPGNTFHAMWEAFIELVAAGNWMFRRFGIIVGILILAMFPIVILIGHEVREWGVLAICFLLLPATLWLLLAFPLLDIALTNASAITATIAGILPGWQAQLQQAGSVAEKRARTGFRMLGSGIGIFIILALAFFWKTPTEVSRSATAAMYLLTIALVLLTGTRLIGLGGLLRGVALLMILGITAYLWAASPTVKVTGQKVVTAWEKAWAGDLFQVSSSTPTYHPATGEQKLGEVVALPGMWTSFTIPYQVRGFKTPHPKGDVFFTLPDGSVVREYANTSRVVADLRGGDVVKVASAAPGYKPVSVEIWGRPY